MIYLDYVATTPLDNEVRESYNELLSKYYFNADSLYDKGVEVHRLMERSRTLLAQMLHVSNEELIFTGSGTESNVMALKGVAFQYHNRGKHIITTAIEHSSVYETCQQLEKVFGFKVTYLPVDTNGNISLEQLEASISEDTILVSIMAINNEMGVINPIHKIKEIVKKHDKVKLHVDMVQALGKIRIDLTDIDLASFSAHKIYGLKGSGLLYKNLKTTIVPTISGGQQEFGLRGGTSNTCTNIIFAKTLRLATDKLEDNYRYVQDLNIYVRKKLLELSDVVINSDDNYCLPHVLNFSCVGYKPEVILHALEAKQIYISTRSACSSKSTNTSRVMKALNIDEKIASSALRISLSSLTSYEDIDTFIYALNEILNTIKKQR
ncbi:MAG: cysteine desulfurase family protein [Coprobacillaceae bacterium]